MAEDARIHMALLIVDAGIEPLSGARGGVDTATLADPHETAARHPGRPFHIGGYSSWVTG